MIKLSEYLEQNDADTGYAVSACFNEEAAIILNKLAEDWRRETLKSKGIKCLRDVILVEPGEADEMVNGLIMPQNTRDKPMRGTVLAVGPGKDEKPMTVKVGDVVFYSRHAGVDVIHEEKECLLMRETDVFAVI